MPYRSRWALGALTALLCAAGAASAEESDREDDTRGLIRQLQQQVNQLQQQMQEKDEKIDRLREQVERLQKEHEQDEPEEDDPESPAPEDPSPVPAERVSGSSESAEESAAPESTPNETPNEALDRAIEELSLDEPDKPRDGGPAGAASGDIASARVGSTNFRLLDVSVDVLTTAGGSTERDESLRTLQGGGHDPKRRGFTLQQAEG
jgi:TolA-binding protein